MPMMCRTGRCVYGDTLSGTRLAPLRWDDQGAWQLQLSLNLDPAAGDYVLSGALHRGEEKMELSEARFVTRGGLVFLKDVVAPLDDSGTFEWIKLLKEQRALRVPKDEANDLVAELNRMTRLPALTLPSELEIMETQPKMRPRLRLRAPGRKPWGADDRLQGELSFDYEGLLVPDGDFSRGVFDASHKRVVLRDGVGETAAKDLLRELGFRFESDPESGGTSPRLNSKLLPKAVKALLHENWHVEADGKLYRRAGSFRWM